MGLVEKDGSQKQTLIHLIIEKQNKRFLGGWNYCSGTSYYKEIVYWGFELAAGIIFLINLWQEKTDYLKIALIYFIKHLAMLIDYVYLILKKEYLIVELLTNLNSIQFWVLWI